MGRVISNNFQPTQDMNEEIQTMKSDSSTSSGRLHPIVGPCPICGDPSCMGNECSAPLDEWERGDADDVHVIGATVVVCPKCGTEMGINPRDGKLGCPHIACCYIGEGAK